jgi:hypothetical protein
MVGYSTNSNTYKIWTGAQIIETKDVIFDENMFEFPYATAPINDNEKSMLDIEDIENDSIFIQLPDDINDSGQHKEPQIESSTLSSTCNNSVVPSVTPRNNVNAVPIASLLNDDFDSYEALQQLPFFFNEQSSSSESSSSQIVEHAIATQQNTENSYTGLNGPAWQNMPPVNENAVITRSQARQIAHRLHQDRQITI